MNSLLKEKREWASLVNHPVLYYSNSIRGSPLKSMIRFTDGIDYTYIIISFYILCKTLWLLRLSFKFYLLIYSLLCKYQIITFNNIIIKVVLIYGNSNHTVKRVHVQDWFVLIFKNINTNIGVFQSRLALELIKLITDK